MVSVLSSSICKDHLILVLYRGRGGEWILCGTSMRWALVQFPVVSAGPLPIFIYICYILEAPHSAALFRD